MIMPTDRSVLEMVAGFGSAAASGLEDPWPGLLDGVARLIEADGWQCRPSASTPIEQCEIIARGLPLSAARLQSINAQLESLECGEVINLRQKPAGGPFLAVALLERVVILHRSTWRDGFPKSSVPIVATIIGACASVHRPRSSLTYLACFDGMPMRLRQVLKGLLMGHGEKQIAGELKISKNTVHVYVKSIYSRAKTNSRGDLLATCFRSGISPESIELESVNVPGSNNFGKLPGRDIDKTQ